MNEHKHEGCCCHADHDEQACACGCDHDQEKGDACACGNEHQDDHEVKSCLCSCSGNHEHEHSCSCSSDREHKHSCGCSGDHGQESGCSCGHDHHDDGCSCGCSCGHDHDNDETAKKELMRLLPALALFAAGMILPVPAWVKTALLLVCYIVSGHDVLRNAWHSLTKGRMLNEHFLMAVASLAAIAIGELTEGCAVMLFYQMGECCQAYAVGRSRRQVKSLLALRAEEAFVLRGGDFVAVDPALVAVGEEIRVRPGERVPLDAVVISGMSEMDTSALTGESVARNAEPGDSVLAGFVAKNGMITARVEKPLRESSVSRILSMVEEAQERKAPAERFITVFARAYTPIVVGLAAALAILPPLVLGEWREWIYRALTFLVASCPCALVVSVPLCYFAGIGSAARQGILIKGGDSLDALCSVKAFVLDKTGTLTTGEFSVRHIHPAAGYSEEDVLALIAGAERDSNHPLALAAVKAAVECGITPQEMTMEREFAGRGVCSRAVDGALVLAGNAAMMQENGIVFDDQACTERSARIYAAKDGKPVGFICLADVIKPGAKDALARLKEQGVSRLVMLTGDRKEPAQAVAAALSVDEMHAQLLPGEKLAHLEEICATATTAFVGDGINDAPALVRANVGVAMGALGSDAAIEAADIVLMTDEMDSLPRAMTVARRVRMLARQNVAIALGIKIAVLILAALGMAGMWAAVFADVGVALICVLNAMRAMR